MPTSNDELIVAGLDGSAASRAAAHWAAADAARRTATLRLVHAAATDQRAATQVPGAAGSVVSATRRAQHLLDDAADEIARSHPGLVVEMISVPGKPGEVLLAESLGAKLLVVGSDGQHATAERALGAVAARVAARSQGSVVVHQWQGRTAEPVASAAVVVGVDGSVHSDRALALAFEEAALCRAQLFVVHAWNDRPLEHALAGLPLDIDSNAVDVDEERKVVDQFQGWSDKYPEVMVDPVVLRGRPAPSLLRFCSGDDIGTPVLLVVGSRGRGSAARALLGSVSRTLLANAMCTVAVAH